MITIIIIALIISLLWFVLIYNRLIQMVEAIMNNKKQIDIQLDRRYKVYESLIEVVKKYMDYEKTTLKEVVALRNQAQKAAASGLEKDRMAAEDAISKIGANLNFVFEQYPDLKANQNALQLQEEIANTENKLTFAKQAYNDSIEFYNAARKSFPQNIVVSMASTKLYKEFEYWGISEEKRVEQEAYKVKLDREEKK
jgi:LemA protein